MIVEIRLPMMEVLHSEKFVHPEDNGVPQNHYYKVWFMDTKKGFIQSASFYDKHDAEEFMVREGAEPKFDYTKQACPSLIYNNNKNKNK